ncbi:MAG TPA: zf-HC2 domain-containing protein [Pyrinomonadaceae bacterium]|jgi:anti-sigma factor RsiW|nr:zf-HC2 domain-containing protein [Pyrinomonadaceae bacterium]
MNNNGHNNSCDLSETLVSYLYGETSAAESDKFKSHLAHCVACTEELAGFGVMRSSLAEWKQEEFAGVTAPVIELPVRDMPVVLTDEPASSWLDGLRAFLTPKIALTAAGFAAVLICLGLAFAFMTSQNPVDKGLVADNSRKEKIETAPKTADAALPAQTENTVNVAAITAIDQPKKNDVKVITEPHEKAPKAVREYSNYQPKNNVAVTNKHQDAPKTNKQDVKTLNTDIYEDTEDDSLRLADLFAEADTE